MRTDNKCHQWWTTYGWRILGNQHYLTESCHHRSAGVNLGFSFWEGSWPVLYFLEMVSTEIC